MKIQSARQNIDFSAPGVAMRPEGRRRAPGLRSLAAWPAVLLVVVVALLALVPPVAAQSAALDVTLRRPAERPTTSQDADLVLLREFVPNIIEDVRYATTNNFTGKVVYPSGRVWLRRRAAVSLAAAATYLAQRHGLRFRVFDGYRPLSVQKRFWAILPDPRYVADPKTGSRHNRGAAIDLTLTDAEGRDLDMGTGFDDFTPRAGHIFRDLPAEVLANRRLLRSVMRWAGFESLDTEWWHYDLSGWAAFPVEDRPIPPES